MFQNFTFNGVSNDVHNVLCIRFDTIETVSGGCETELKTEKATRSNKFQIIEQSYSAPMEFKLQLIHKDGSPITIDNERTLKNWLCIRGVYKWFHIDELGFENIDYKVNISNPQLIDIANVVGMEFTVTTDAPFGYSPIINQNYSITTESKTATINVTSDEDDYTYPKVIMTMAEAGNLEITNSTEVANRTFVLNNVSLGEVITIDSELPDISSSITHDVYGDFNKHWIRFINGDNVLTFNLNCTVAIQYREIRKVGIY